MWYEGERKKKGGKKEARIPAHQLLRQKKQESGSTRHDAKTTQMSRWLIKKLHRPPLLNQYVKLHKKTWSVNDGFCGLYSIWSFLSRLLQVTWMQWLLPWFFSSSWLFICIEVRMTLRGRSGLLLLNTRIAASGMQGCTVCLSSDSFCKGGEKRQLHISPKNVLNVVRLHS